MVQLSSTPTTLWSAAGQVRSLPVHREDEGTADRIRQLLGQAFIHGLGRRAGARPFADSHAPR